jgi:diaminopimelate decarboxylase
MFNKEEINQCIDVAKRNNGSVYVYNKRIIKEKYELLRNNLPKNIDIYYAIKANSFLDVVELLCSLDAGADIASGGELEIAYKAGIPSEKIGFAGPGKTEEELKAAITSNIASINVESIQELLLIDRLAAESGKKQPVCVRINPQNEVIKSGMRMAGGAKQFGIDEEKLDEFFTVLSGLMNIEFKGLHIFAGSQVLDYKLLLEYFENVLKIAINIQKNYPVSVSILNFGGGFGIPYFAKEEELDIQSFGKGLKELFKKNDVKTAFPETRFVVESGRFLVGESGLYITKVLYRKESRGKEYIITEGGMNHHLAASGLLGSILRKNYKIKVLNKYDNQVNQKYNIVGPLCTTLDSLANNIELPDVQPGDLIGIFNSGAYGYVSSPINFLNHPPPKQVMI